MADLLKLADKWRKESDDFGFACGNPYDVFMDGFMCASELESALSAYKWVKITDDPESKPENNTETVLTAECRNGKWIVDTWEGVHLQNMSGIYYRKLGPIDTPPQESE